MKKLKTIGIVMIVFVLIAFTVYEILYLIKKNFNNIQNTVKSNNDVYISKVLEQLANNKNTLVETVAKNTAEELNTVQKNPYDKSQPFYVVNKQCLGCSKIEYDNTLEMIIISTLDKKGELTARTVIKPPSFVTYYKDENNN